MGKMDLYQIMFNLVNTPKWRARLPKVDPAPIPEADAVALCEAAEDWGLLGRGITTLTGLAKKLTEPFTRDELRELEDDRAKELAQHLFGSWIEFNNIVLTHERRKAILLDDRGLGPMKEGVREAWNSVPPQHGLTPSDVDELMQEFMQEVRQQQAATLIDGIEVRDTHVLRLENDQLFYSKM